jgi:hypothetical protein
MKKGSTLEFLVLASLVSTVFAISPAQVHATGITIGTIDPATQVITPAADTPTGSTLSTTTLYGTTYTQSPSHTALSLSGEGTSLTLQVASSTPTGGKQDIPGLVAAGYVTEAATAATGNMLSLTDQAAITVNLGYHYQDSDTHYSLAGGISSQGAAIDNNVTLNNTLITLVNNPQQAADETNPNNDIGDLLVLQKNWQVSASLVGGAGALTAAGNTVSITDAVITGTYNGVYTKEQNSPLKLNVTGGAALASEATSGMSANHNSVTITQTAAGDTSTGAYGDITGGFSSYGEANNNAVKLENLTGANVDNVYGGLSGIDANPYGWHQYNKIVQLDYDQITLKDLSQAYAVSYTADNNTVSVSGSNAKKGVYGGYAAGYTEVKSAATTDSTVTVPVTLTAQASGNTVTVADSTAYGISGGMAEGNLFTDDGFDTDHITISPQLIMHTDKNIVKVTNSTIDGDVRGGYNRIIDDYGTNSYQPNPDRLSFFTADGNTIYLENSQVGANVFGGTVIDQYDDYNELIPSPYQGEANGNNVTLINTTADEEIIGGYIMNLDEFDPSATLDAPMTLDEIDAIMKPSDTNNNTVTIIYQLDTSEDEPAEFGHIAGGYTYYGDANGNQVYAVGKILGTGAQAWANWTDDNSSIEGGYTEGGSANDNSVTVKYAAPDVDVVGGEVNLYTGFILDDTGKASYSTNNNTVSLVNVHSVYENGDQVYGFIRGGWLYAVPDPSPFDGIDDWKGEFADKNYYIPSSHTTAQIQFAANSNTVTMLGDTATPSIAIVEGVDGGYLEGTVPVYVPVNMTDTRTYTATAASNNNTVSLSDYQSGYVVGGVMQLTVKAASEKSDEATGTPGTVTLNATGTANNNKVSLFGSTITSSVLGGAAVVNPTADEDLSNTGITFNRTHSDTAQGNTVILAKTKVTDNVIGGLALRGTAAANTVTMGTDSQATSLYGGVSSYGKATGNTVNLAGGTVTSVYGGATGIDSTLLTSLSTIITTLADANAAITDSDDSTSDANGNTVNYYGGTVTDSIIAGQSDSAAASDNVVNLYAALVGENLNLYGGIGQTESTGNTLNVYAKGNSVANLDHFQNYNFYVPADTVAGDTVLTVTDTANLTNATVKAGVEETMNLSEGQVIDLISGTHALQDTGATYAMLDGKDVLTDAAFLQRKVSIWKQDDNTVVIGIRKGTQPTLNPDTKLFAEDRAAAVNLVNTGSDFAATAAYDGALTVWNGDAATKGDFTPYLVVGGHDLRADTGSYVDTYGLNANLGFVKRTSQKGHTDTLMPFLEYGNGNYTSHLDNGARGDGDQRYIGAGLLARRDLASGIHYEAMVRAGRTNGDFHGQIANHLASYDTSAPYVSAMLGAGKIVKKDKASIDYYGKVFWTHLGSDSVQMHSDLGTSQYDFDNVDSYRTRLGFRWTKDVSPTMSYYAGLAWNYEFGDNGEARYGTFDTLAAGVKGSSGMLELGWQSKIDKDHDWGADLHITGWTGVQRGVTYSATVSRAF